MKSHWFVNNLQKSLPKPSGFFPFVFLLLSSPPPAISTSLNPYKSTYNLLACVRCTFKAPPNPKLIDEYEKKNKIKIMFGIDFRFDCEPFPGKSHDLFIMLATLTKYKKQNQSLFNFNNWFRKFFFFFWSPLHVNRVLLVASFFSSP